MPDPSGYRIRTSDPEARSSPVTRVPREGPTDEEALVERVVQEVLRRLDERNAAPAAPVEDDPYIPVRRNRPVRPMSEY